MSEPLTATLNGCARCGADGHPNLTFRQLTHPVPADDGKSEWTHWALCPTNGEPILLRVVGEDA